MLLIYLQFLALIWSRPKVTVGYDTCRLAAKKDLQDDSYIAPQTAGVRLVHSQEHGNIGGANDGASLQALSPALDL